MTVPVNVLDGAGHTVVVPEGRLYFDTVEPVREALLTLAAADRPHIVLDLSRVETCDSSALNLMAQVHQAAARRGGWLRVVAPQPHVVRVLEVTNLTRLLAVYDTVAQAAP